MRHLAVEGHHSPVVEVCEILAITLCQVEIAEPDSMTQFMTNHSNIRHAIVEETDTPHCLKSYCINSNGSNSFKTSQASRLFRWCNLPHPSCLNRRWSSVYWKQNDNIPTSVGEYCGDLFWI